MDNIDNRKVKTLKPIIRSIELDQSEVFFFLNLIKRVSATAEETLKTMSHEQFELVFGLGINRIDSLQNKLRKLHKLNGDLAKQMHEEKLSKKIEGNEKPKSGLVDHKGNQI